MAGLLGVRVMLVCCMLVVMQVRAICWSANDSSIVSAGADGAVYEWRLSDFKRCKENVLKGCQYRWVGGDASDVVTPSLLATCDM
jgi:hypothetical protein